MQAGSECSGGLGSWPGPIFDGNTTALSLALTRFVEIRIFDDELLWAKPFQGWEILIRALGFDVENGRWLLVTMARCRLACLKDVDFVVDIPHSKAHTVIDDFDLGLPMRIR